LLGDYIVPSLDTTIYSTAQMLYGLATEPGAWDRLRSDPGLISSTIDEAVRLATPLRGFTRVATADFALEESVIPAWARVWLLYGSANLDERKYADPDRFDVGRNPRDHLGWGHGVHLCLGKNLARLEMESVLRAMLRHVERLECETSRRLINNSAQGFAELHMRLIPNSV
jgi:cytochrome P450